MDVLGATVIVVDDDEQVLRMIAKVLTRRGYRSVHTTSHPDEVLEMCRELKPDLMLLDLNMPGVSGFEILKATRNQILDFEPIPVVVLTGERGRDSRIEALELGAQDYIVKPFDFEVLARIKNLLERRLLSKIVNWRSGCKNVRPNSGKPRLRPCAVWDWPPSIETTIPGFMS